MQDTHSAQFVSYVRVSTERQGKSGLGLDAQRTAVNTYIAGERGELLQEHREIESGKKDDRPQLTAALAACRKHKAVLVIAKLDRLARRVSFISALMDGDVDFVACDFPQANRLTLHILAAVAEHEREMISQRTRSALQAARIRGVKLGNPTNANECLDQARAARAAEARRKCPSDSRPDHAIGSHHAPRNCWRLDGAWHQNGQRRDAMARRASSGGAQAYQ